MDKEYKPDGEETGSPIYERSRGGIIQRLNAEKLH